MTPAPDPSPSAAGGPRGRLPWGTVISGAFVVTLLRPVSWALGLAGFLAGGGILLVAWPILVLPTPTGLQNALGGPVSSLVFGDPSPGLVALIAAGAAALLLLVLAGTLAGAWAERQGIAVALEAAADDDLGLPAADLDGAPGAGRVAVVRLLGLAPVVIVAALAWRPFYDATYRRADPAAGPGHAAAAPHPGRRPVAGDRGRRACGCCPTRPRPSGVRRLVLDRQPVLAAWLHGLGRPRAGAPSGSSPRRWWAWPCSCCWWARRWRRRRSAGCASATSSSVAATRSSSSARSRSGSRSGWAVSCSRASGPPSGPRRGRWRCRCCAAGRPPSPD